MHCCALLYTAVHCCALLYTTVHCCTLLYTALHCCALLYTAVHCCTLLYTAVHCFTLLYTAVNCCALLYIAVHCCKLLYTAVHCCTQLYTTSIIYLIPATFHSLHILLELVNLITGLHYEQHKLYNSPLRSFPHVTSYVHKYSVHRTPKHLFNMCPSLMARDPVSHPYNRPSFTPIQHPVSHPYNSRYSCSLRTLATAVLVLGCLVCIVVVVL